MNAGDANDITQRKIHRRDFVKGAALTGAALIGGGFTMAENTSKAVADASPTPPPDVNVPVPKKALGKTGLMVSALGIGGFHLGTATDQSVAGEIVSRAMDAGVNFFDNAWEYHEGESEVRLGQALKGRREQAVVMTKVCTHGRSKAVAMRMLEESLTRLQTDHLDVWQIHEVIYDNDPDLIFAPGGVAEALLEAKKQGKVRFIGFTGHKDPAIHLKMLSHDFPFDTVQMPLNCFDATFRSFETHVMPEANRRQIAVLGMKSLGGSGEMVTLGAITPEEGLRYAMSLPVATTISGIDSLNVLEQNLAIARGFTPMSNSEMAALRARCRRWPATATWNVSRPPGNTTGTSDESNMVIPPRRNCHSSGDRFAPPHRRLKRTAADLPDFDLLYMQKLSNKRIAILAADGFEQVELQKPKEALENAGAKTEIVSPASNQIQGMNHDEKGDMITVDVSLEKANASQYDALMIPGGLINPDTLRSNKQALEFVKGFFAAGKPVAAICHAAWVLIDADLVRGRTLTSWPAIKTDVKNAGGNWVDKEVVVDHGLVTSRKPGDIPAFNEKMIEEFGEGKHEEQAELSRV